MPIGWYPLAQRIDGVYTYTPGGENKVGICSHTAGGYYRTMLNVDFWNVSAKCSVHFAISRRGEVAQLVNIFDRAWGQGRLNQVSWPPYAEMGYRNPNEYLISIEHEDAETINGKTVFFPEWTPQQLQASIEVQRWCREEIATVKGVDVLRFGQDSIAGHYMFDAVNRANCPPIAWKTNYRFQVYNALTAQIQKGRRDMAIVILNGGAYFMYGAKIGFIESEALLNELRGMVYGNAETVISQATWDWLFAYGFLTERVR